MHIRQFAIAGLVALASFDAKDHAATATSILIGMMQALLCMAVLSVPLRAADPHTSAEERTQVLKWLDESHQEFFAAIDGVSDAQWKWKPAPEWPRARAHFAIVFADRMPA